MEGSTSNEPLTEEDQTIEEFMEEQVMIGDWLDNMFILIGWGNMSWEEFLDCPFPRCQNWIKILCREASRKGGLMSLRQLENTVGIGKLFGGDKSSDSAITAETQGILDPNEVYQIPGLNGGFA